MGIDKVNNYQLLADYANGVDRNATTSESISGLGNELLFGAGITAAIPVLPYGKKALWDVPAYMFNNKGTKYTSAWQKLSENAKAQKEALSYLKDGESKWQTLQNKSTFSKMTMLENEIPKAPTQALPELNTTAKVIKYNNQTQASSFYDEARQLIQEAKDKKLKGKELKEQLKKIKEAIRKGDIKLHQAKVQGLIKPATKLGQASNFVKNKTGYNYVKGKILNTSKGSSVLKTIGRNAKGAGIMAAISGVCEIPDIAEAYKCSTESGNKQLAKSAGRVVASTAGYIAGSAALGAAVGSVVPVAGTVVGAVVGAVGGILGSFLANKAVDAVAGTKTEAEIYKEKQADEAAKTAKESTKGKQELIASVEHQAEIEEAAPDEVIQAYEQLAAEIEKEENGNSKTTSAQAEISSEYADIINELRNFTNIASGNYLNSTNLYPDKGFSNYGTMPVAGSTNLYPDKGFSNYGTMPIAGSTNLYPDKGYSNYGTMPVAGSTNLYPDKGFSNYGTMPVADNLYSNSKFGNYVLLKNNKDIAA